ncbi:hypothetical protein QUF94_04550 [Peribacillus sp. NJ4]|uniref:hypothetical protein n=1 Tax=Peribacillus TaxID=2675229 RepID=UPI00070F11F8|nr:MULTISPECIES: hypothetical protein [Peribacillus]KRF54018.1 hypothetical protein ASG99_27780 [Bacillus sp. Soil768D1]MDM5210711.1 hypothetical protein [Peribacillus sp. NJ4]MED3983181.1 hypothetical protein [Peribacillus simplex]MED4095275.1 hypothetical protein [Peribacillus simplex]CAH0212340.1 hypothetical protein SRABI84_02173 [Peribacillus simplex]
MNKERQLVIPLDGLIKFKENSTRFLLKYRYIILTLAIIGTFYFLLENQMITVDLYFYLSAFKIITTYILPWGILYCLIQIMKRTK